jgi:hypothetical protein
MNKEFSITIVPWFGEILQNTSMRQKNRRQAPIEMFLIHSCLHMEGGTKGASWEAFSLEVAWEISSEL